MKFRAMGFFILISALGCAAAWAEPSRFYSVKLSGDWPEVAVEHYKKVHLARFTLPKMGVKPRDAEVTIETSEPIREWRISPESLKIKAKVEGARLAFTLGQPALLVVRINEAEPLFLFAEAPEENVYLMTQHLRNIASSGIDTSGGRIETEKIQRAIDDLPRDGVLHFPRGIYRTGTIRLKSDMTLSLAEGAVLLGSTDIADYPADKIGRRLVMIDGAKNVAIRGRGVIDGNGRALRQANNDQKAHLLTVARSQDVRIEDVWLRDAAAWCTHIIGCDRVNVRGVRLVSDPELANTDGFDPDASREVLIENCFAYCGDDTVAIKTTNHDGLGRDVSGVTVRGNVFLTRKSALKVGTESRTARMGGIVFENNDVLHCDRGMALYCNDGAAYEDIRFVNNRFEDNYPDAKRRMIDFSITNRAGKGTIKDVLIKDCAFKQPFPQASTIEGLDAQHGVSGVRFENFTIGGTRCLGAEDAHIKPGKYVEKLAFK